MKAPILLAALVLLAPSSDAQVGTKKRSNKGSGATVGKKSRVTGDVFDRERGGTGGTVPTPAPGASAAPILGEARLRLGDRVRGHLADGASHRASFEAVEGTRLTLEIAPADKRLSLAARLLGPEGTHLLTPSGKESDPAVLRVDDYVCPRTGVYTVEVAFTAGQAGEYRIETSGDHPDRVERDLAVAGRKPSRLRLSGLDGRTISELKVRVLGDGAADGEPLDLWAQLVDPDGVTIPLDSDSWRSTDGRTLLLTRVPLDRCGDYSLAIMERGDAHVTVRVTARFDDPGPTRRVHEL